MGKGIKSWPKTDRPREKLLRNGEHTLSTSELLAILLRTGVRGQSALDLARQIIDKFKTLRNMSHSQPSVWEEFKGLGTAKIAQIKAALEIGRRLSEETVFEGRQKIQSSKDAAVLLTARLRDLKKEVFKVILLNAQHVVIEIIEITEGTVNEAFPIIREVYLKALHHFAVSLICAHNHPSGNPAPSSEDAVFTGELVKAGALLNVKVLDHIIIGQDTYYSFADNKRI